MSIDSSEASQTRLARLVAAYAGKRVLVTGASGFLGQHLVRRLLDLNCAFIGCVSRRFHPHSSDRLAWLNGDLSDQRRATEIFREARPDIAFHLTSESRGDQGIGNVVPTFKNDLEATINCLMAAHEAGRCRFVIAASLEEPPLQPGEDPVPLTPYAAAKFAASCYARMFHRIYDLPVVLLRTFMTYGPGQKDHKVIPYTVLSLLSSKVPHLSSGERLIDWIYVADVVDAFVRAGIAPKASGRMIDIGSARLVPLRVVISKIHQLVGGPTPILGVMPDRGETRSANLDDAFDLLQWQCTTGLDDGLRQTVDWYRQRAKEESPFTADGCLYP